MSHSKLVGQISYPTRSPRSSVREPTNSKLETDATSTTAGTPPISSYITSKLFALLFLNSTFCIRTLYIFCKCYKMCFFTLHTTFSLQQVHSLPSHTTCKFPLYFVNKLRWNNTDLGIGGSMATPSTIHLPILQRRPSSRLRLSYKRTSRSTSQGVFTPYIQFTLSFPIQILT